MADLIELNQGTIPWNPPHTERVQILNTWGMPLAGLVRQHHRAYFFLCLEGEVASANLWGYVPIDRQEELSLLEGDFHRAFEQLVSDGRVWVAALSQGDAGIQTWVYVEDQKPEEPPLSAALRALHMNEEELDRFLASA